MMIEVDTGRNVREKSHKKYLAVNRRLQTMGQNYEEDHHHHVLPKGRSFSANSGTKAAILPKVRSSIANSGTKAAVLLGMNRCGSFPLLSAPHSHFSI